MDDLHKSAGEQPVGHGASLSAPYTIDQAIAEAVDALDNKHATMKTGEETAARPSSDPSAEEAGVQYWIWTGSRLVRASSQAAERLRQQEELEQEELRRLQERQRVFRLQRRHAYKRIMLSLILPLRRLAATFHSWQRYRRGQPRVEAVPGNDSIDRFDRIS